MKELQLSDPLKAGYYAYHISGGKIDDYMRVSGGYVEPVASNVKQIISDGWSFVSRTKKYRKGQKASIPKSQVMPSKEYIAPPKVTGIIIRNATPGGCGINCITLRNAYDKLLGAMTAQDERDFINGKLCVSVQIIKTPTSFNPTQKV